MPTLATALLDGLKAYGASEIFGIPGDFVLPFFKVIEESRILPFYTLSHEPAVGFAADAAVNAVAGAYAERSPVVVVAGAPSARERVRGLLLHHQVRSVDTQFAVYREITCDQAGTQRSPNRAGRDRARIAQRARALAAGLYRISA